MNVNTGEFRALTDQVGQLAAKGGRRGDALGCRVRGRGEQDPGGDARPRGEDVRVGKDPAAAPASRLERAVSTAPGGDAMTVQYHRDTALELLKWAKVPRPLAWRIRPSEIARLTADGKHCETRKCREPVAIVTWRWWRSTADRRVLLSEHLVCERHGTEFGARHHTGVDPAGRVAARHMSDVEMLALWVEHRHCDWPACQIAATWIFIESYSVHGEPRSDQDLSCDRHARAFAARLHLSITPEPGEGGAP